MKLKFNLISEWGEDKIIIKNKNIEKVNIGFDGLSLITNRICFTKENLILPTITVFKNSEGKLKYEINMNNVQEFQIEFLKNQLNEILELIKVCPDYFIENGHAHLAKLYQIFYEIHRRSNKTNEN